MRLLLPFRTTPVRCYTAPTAPSFTTYALRVYTRCPTLIVERCTLYLHLCLLPHRLPTLRSRYRLFYIPLMHSVPTTVCRYVDSRCYVVYLASLHFALHCRCLGHVILSTPDTTISRTHTSTFTLLRWLPFYIRFRRCRFVTFVMPTLLPVALFVPVIYYGDFIHLAPHHTFWLPRG